MLDLFMLYVVNTGVLHIWFLRGLSLMVWRPGLLTAWVDFEYYTMWLSLIYHYTGY